MTFLFWNLMRQPIGDRLARITKVHEVDFVLLAECPYSPAEMLSILNSPGGSQYRFPVSLNDKIQVFSRMQASRIVEKSNTNLNRLSMREIRRRGGQDLLLGVLHFQSRVNWSETDQFGEATRCAREVARVEREVGHRRTILVGDFNMNPFSPAVVSSHGFHAMMTRERADERGRRVAGEVYDFFYNPMWSVFGDQTPGPPGTYYFSGSNPVNYYWNVYDQVLVRPALKDAFFDVRILDFDGELSLLTRSGLPDARNGSDHLPLMFRLNLER